MILSFLVHENSLVFQDLVEEQEALDKLIIKADQLKGDIFQSALKKEVTKYILGGVCKTKSGQMKVFVCAVSTVNSV